MFYTKIEKGEKQIILSSINKGMQSSIPFIFCAELREQIGWVLHKSTNNMIELLIIFRNPKHTKLRVWESEEKKYIPNLKLNKAAMDGDFASSEVNTDGEIVNRMESFISKFREQARFLCS
ncbi:hypothetical protein OIU74_004423 [Salix koriyanagi]|uniref:Uncharacterized protein n=1 Tax=Salix koriyanagi TaxID=2511006 RepID=A0A9Q0ZMD8_9ROSI|nr:hypothetical protein OIU74_004423 [Salix koriyanagi]